MAALDTPSAADIVSVKASFGTALRQLRTSHGMSLADLSAAVHYSKGYLSKIETGLASPNLDLARLCDAELDARGELIGLLPEPAVPRRAKFVEIPADDMNEKSTGQAEIMAAAITSAALSGLQAVLDSYRAVARVGSPQLISAGLRQQATQILELAEVHPVGSAPLLIVLALRFAEYAGWIEHELGNYAAALGWLDRGASLAVKADLHDPVVSYLKLRRADVALNRGDGETALLLAQQVHVDESLRSTLRGLAALQEARAHALRGDMTDCHRALDTARDFVKFIDVAVNNPVAGSDLARGVDLVAVVAGWVSFDLGQPAESVEILRNVMPCLPADNVRLRVRVGVRLALALATASELDASCDLAESLVDEIRQVDSATIRPEVRLLRRVLGRWNTASVTRIRSLLLDTLAAPASQPRADTRGLS